jgi:hypothetical protein
MSMKPYRVVALVILRSFSRLPVAAIASPERVRVEAADVAVISRECDMHVLRRGPRDYREGAFRGNREHREVLTLTQDVEAGGRPDGDVERRRSRDVADADGDVVESARRSVAGAMNGLEAVAFTVLEKRRVIVLRVCRAGARGAVVDQAGSDAGDGEPVDVFRCRCDEGGVGTAGDRTVGPYLGEHEVPPH